MSEEEKSISKRLPARAWLVETLALSLAYLAVAFVLFAHWSAIAEHVVDVPYADDWRQLRNGRFLLPQDFDLRWMFLSSNRTVYATGKLLDYLFFTYTDGSYATYQQSSSAIVLGGCCLVTVLLLRRLRLPLPWHLLGVLSTVAFLQVGSYWGIATLAYHQTLPVLGMLVIAWLVTGRRSGLPHVVLLGIVVLASGLAYVSGAVAMFSVGVFLVAAALGFPAGAQVPGFRRKAWVVLAAGALTLIVQLALVEKLLLREGQRALPLDWPFWHFGFRLVGRALGVVEEAPYAALQGSILAALVLGVTVAAIAQSARRSTRVAAPGRTVLGPDATYAVVAGIVLVTVAGFLVVICYGRGQPDLANSALEPARAARVRFHYWWVTALLPWAVVAPHFLGHRRGPAAGRGRRALAWVPVLLITCTLAAQQSLTPWSFDSYYERQAKRHESGVKCLRRGYWRKRPLRCPELVGTAIEGDLRPHVENARARSLRFARKLD